MNTLLILLTAFWQSVFPFPGPSGSSPIPALVQQSDPTTPTGNCQVTNSATTWTCVLPSTPTAGNVLILNEGSRVSFNAINPSGLSQTNVAWTRVTFTEVNSDPELWCGDISAGASATLSITFNSPNFGNAYANLSEWRNTKSCANRDSATTSGSAATCQTCSSASRTPTAAAGSNFVFFTNIIQSQIAAFTSGPTNSFVALNTPNVTFQPAYFVTVLNGGAYSTSWTFGASNPTDGVIMGISH